MNILENVNLAFYSTMGLGGNGAYLTTIESRTELLEALAWAKDKKLPCIMIGGGSNIFWRDEGFTGLVIVNGIKRYEISEQDDENIYITVGAGEVWDSVVERTVNAGLTGIEALSLIPGSAGATPIQNVGAYGQEISGSLVTVEAYDTEAEDFVTIPAGECDFSYRNSRFKGKDRSRFFITAITLHLSRGSMKPPFYQSLAAYLEESGISDYSPASIREAVIDIRSSKLPDPNVIKNNGSFFANPIISNSSELMKIQKGHPGVQAWTLPDGSAKISAAWLIEQAGFKDYKDPETGMATWPKQSLVLVNERAMLTADLLKFKKQIVDAVKKKFGVTLIQEPELLP